MFKEGNKMKKTIFLILSILLLNINLSYATVGWNKILPQTSENPQAISPDVQENNNAIARMLQNYRDGYLTVTLTSTSAITIGAGGVMLSNSGGSTRLMVANTSTTTMSSTNIDTGSISPSSTYYIYAYTSSTTATTFSVIYSASATSPTGITYYKRLGSFTTDSSSNFVGVNSDVSPPGPFSTQNIVTASRAQGTVYQNLTGKTMMVNVSIYLNNGITVSANTDSSSSPSTTVAQANNNTGTNGLIQSFTFMVLSNNYYEIPTFSGSIQRWVEWS